MKAPSNAILSQFSILKIIKALVLARFKDAPANTTSLFTDFLY